MSFNPFIDFTEAVKQRIKIILLVCKNKETTLEPAEKEEVKFSEKQSYYTSLIVGGVGLLAITNIGLATRDSRKAVFKEIGAAIAYLSVAYTWSLYIHSKHLKFVHKMDTKYF